jgi:prepilin-type N-terminal cleavage/methylation domain-containing protein
MKNTKAFTLVELIVVITILAILWTIAFVSFQGYTRNSRDSVRFSDISKIKLSLELFIINNWKYPDPTNWINITYSGTTIWQQWNFWESTFINVKNLNKIPTDPLVNSEYTYSVTTNRMNYEIWWILEWNNLSQLNLINKTYALWTIDAQSYVIWTYNWKILKVLSWSICDVLTIPTIITTHIESDTDLSVIIAEKKFAYKWFNNLPWSFTNNIFTEWGFDFSPKKLVAYSDTWSCLALSTDQSKRLELYNNIKFSYDWTLLNDLLPDIWISNFCDSQEKEILLSKDIVQNNLLLNVIDWETIECIQDANPPIILSSWPTWTIISSWAIITATTNEIAICKYDTSDISYELMINTFETTNSINHETPYIATEWINNIYIKCKDSFNNESPSTNIIFTYTYSEPVIINISPGDWWTYTCESCN